MDRLVHDLAHAFPRQAGFLPDFIERPSFCTCTEKLLLTIRQFFLLLQPHSHTDAIRPIAAMFADQVSRRHEIFQHLRDGQPPIPGGKIALNAIIQFFARYRIVSVCTFPEVSRKKLLKLRRLEHLTPERIRREDIICRLTIFPHVHVPARQ